MPSSSLSRINDLHKLGFFRQKGLHVCRHVGGVPPGHGPAPVAMASRLRMQGMRDDRWWIADRASAQLRQGQCSGPVVCQASRWMSLLRDAWIQAPSMEIAVPEASSGSWTPSRNAAFLTYAKKSVSEIRMRSEYRTWLVQLSE